MKLIKRTSAVVLLLIGVFAFSSASANTVDLRYTGFVGGSASGTLYDSASPSSLIGNRSSLGVNAGLFGFDVLGSSGDMDWGNRVEAFCVQTGIALNTGTTHYSVMDAGDYFGATQLGAIQSLYGNYHESLGTTAGNVAFQLALWEIINENSSSYSLGTGNFTATGFGGAASTADNWLNNMGDFAGQFAMYVLTAGNSQDLLVIKPRPVGVPEPGTLLLLSIGLLALAFGVRRRNVG
ncbi:PEP-CTERM sorting domain-containing protein [Thioalkalivibrio sulfidiphilus]|uniref:PEP-CTERM sorting domain-containing protein n=1 Tax=Thioalkalivibrio sulfidiphilus TaxID=1033854 RepID=UPI00038005C4|nr:PEP-CTERM sorting domain-containing protein [Thioalkalivibrio sulfidiphilus]